MLNKKSYFQGGGGVNEPTPGKRKYKADPALVVQPRFKEPFYRNYDLYTIPEMEDVGPGTGYHGLQNYKSVQEFLTARRERLKPRYVADDSWQLDSGERVKKNNNRQARIAIFEKIIKNAKLSDNLFINDINFDLGLGFYENKDHYKSVRDYIEHTPLGYKHPVKIKPEWKRYEDVNNIDFPVDDEVNHYDEMIYPEEGQYHPPMLVGPEGPPGDVSSFPSASGPDSTNISFTSPQIAGEHSYLPSPDFEDRSDEALNFGRDYTEDAEPSKDLTKEDLEKLMNKYLTPAESDLFGLPDGIDPISDVDADQTEQVEQPYDTISDISQQMYQDKWNI